MTRDRLAKSTPRGILNGISPVALHLQVHKMTSLQRNSSLEWHLVVRIDLGSKTYKLLMLFQQEERTSEATAIVPEFSP